MNADKRRSGCGAECSGFVFAEIGYRSALEAAVPVDGGANLGGRKFKTILRGLVFQTLHFAKLQEAGGFLQVGFALALRVAWRDCSRARFFRTARFNRCS